MNKKLNYILMKYIKEIQYLQERNQKKLQNIENNITRNHKINFHLSKSIKNSKNLSNRHSERSINKVNKNILMADDFNNFFKFNNKILSEACLSTFNNSKIKNKFKESNKFYSFKKDKSKSNLYEGSELNYSKFNSSEKYEEGKSKIIPKILALKNFQQRKINNFQLIKAKTITNPTKAMSYKNRLLNTDKISSKNSLKCTSNQYRLNSATIASNINKNCNLKLYDNSSTYKPIFDIYYSDKSYEKKNIHNNNYDNLYFNNNIVKRKNKNLIFNSKTNIFKNKHCFYRKIIPCIDSIISDYKKIKNNKYNFFNRPLLTKEIIPTSNTKDLNSIEVFLKKKIISNCNKIKCNKSYYKKPKINLNNELLSQVNNNEGKIKLFYQYGEFLKGNSDDCKKNIIYKPIKINIKNKILLEEKIKNLDIENDEPFKIMSKTFREKNKYDSVNKYSGTEK